MILGDSIIKHINRAKHLRVRSYPGACVYHLYNRILSGELDVCQHSIVICSVGTNDICNLKVDPSVIAQGIMFLFHTINQFNPEALLIYSGMIIRPKDLGTILERRRRLVNDIVYRQCQANGIQFLKSWKCLMRKSDLRPYAYGRDGLHLSRLGAIYLYKFLEGNIRTVEGLMKL